MFVDSTGSSRGEDIIDRLVRNGIRISGHRFVFGERSASMTRTGIFSFVDEDIWDDLNKRLTMDIKFDKTVLSKYYAYRGLFFSSCHCIENWKPKIIIVPDMKFKMKDQTIKYLYDAEVPYVDKDGNDQIWKQKDIAVGQHDVKMNAFDGCGIHHPNITKYLTEYFGSKYPVTSILMRLPYIKGVSHCIDYETWFVNHGIEYIQDIWGKWHSVHDEMFILTESMYKGYHYFAKYNDSRDWDNYWDLFDKYEHCFGVAKWNFSFAEEPIFTRGNYQIFQDLMLPYEQFRELADDSLYWAERIMDGDPIYTYAFLGLMADRCKPVNAYAKAILKNPAMLSERCVRAYLRQSLKKYIDDMKCGKLWVKGSFKFIIPDMVMLLQHIAKIDTTGCLEHDEFWSRDFDGTFHGKHLLERNPHICKTEHVVLNAVTSDEIEDLVGHLANVCMVNCKSLVAQRLNGCDFDGDLVLVLKNDTMMDGVNNDEPPVIDIDDKITALEEPDTTENRIALTMRTLHSLIGEYSNYSCAYHNKMPKEATTKERYNKYIDQISVLTGKAIDMAKTGIFYKMPSHIAKYGRPLPYFMKYRKEYYANQKLSKVPSNMNRLCMDIEHWQKVQRWKPCPAFDYSIMIDDDVGINESMFGEIEKIFLSYTKELSAALSEQRRIRRYEDKDIKQSMSRFEATHYIANLDSIYDRARNDCRKVCDNEKMLANICVKLAYDKYSRKNSKFAWIVAENGILENIKQIDGIKLPKFDRTGDYLYLGKACKLEPMIQNDDLNENIFEDFEEVLLDD